MKILRNCKANPLQRSLWALALLFLSAHALPAENYGQYYPLYIATDAGNVYKMDANRNISPLTSGGLIVQAGGTAVDSHGTLYVSGYPAAIVKVDSTGQQSLLTSGGFLYLPTQMAFDHTGNLYVATIGTSIIVKVDPTGRQTAISAGSLDLSGGVAFDDSGNLYVTALCSGDGCLVKIDPSGQQQVLANHISTTDTVTIDRSGQLWLTASYGGWFYKLTADGTIVDTNYIGLASVVNLFDPGWALAQDFNGTMWVGGYSCSSNCVPGFGPITKTAQGVLLADPVFTVGGGGTEAVMGLAFSRGYTMSGFGAPVANPPSLNTGKAGRTYPIKWSLLKADNTWQSSLSAVTSITFQSVACSAFGDAPTTTLTTTSTDATNLRYDSAANQYIYNLNSPSTPGCYDLQVTLDSGQTLIANFQLR